MTPYDVNSAAETSLGQSSEGMPRREMMTSMGIAAAAFAGLGFSTGALGQNSSPFKPDPAPMSPETMGWDPKAEEYVLPPLPYKAEALDPHIDRQTMELHHDKHHLAYVEGLNAALKNLAEIRSGKRNASETKHWLRELAFHGSGHFLHVLFWNSMGPKGGGQPASDSAVGKQIDADFGSFKQFSDQFQAAAVAVEGGGWAILVWEPIAQQLMIMQAEKHQNLTAWGVQPLLPIDVWEHAYYLKYQNKRKDYVAAFMNVINWEAIERRFTDLTKAKRA